MTKNYKAIIFILLTLLGGTTLYNFFSKEVVLYEKQVDGYGFTANVTCRPDVLFIYYPYLIVKTPEGLEVARSQITSDSYEALNACRSALPVTDLSLTNDRTTIRLQIAHRGSNTNSPEYIDVPISFFPR